MNLAFTTLACPDWDLAQIIDCAVACGYRGIDFRGYLREMEIWRLGEFSIRVAATREAMESAGLVVSGFSSGARMFEGDSDKRRQFIEEVAQYSCLCRAFGAKFIRVFGGAIGDIPRDSAVELAAEMLTDLAAAAAPATVAVETHDDWCNSTDVAAVMQRVTADNVCVLWDIHHTWRIAGEQPEQTHAALGRWIRGTHVKDSSLTADGGYEYCMPGRGGVPLSRAVGLLRSAGYDGFVTVEWEKLWHDELADAEVALPAYADYLRRL